MAHNPLHVFLIFFERAFNAKNYFLISLDAHERDTSIAVTPITIGSQIKKFIFRTFGFNSRFGPFIRH